MLCLIKKVSSRPLQRSVLRSFSKDTSYVSTESNPMTGALIPSLEFSTTFERDENGILRDGFYYSRVGNPTRREFEKIFTKLEEGGVESFAFSSGMQAATSILLSSPGSYLLLPDDLYHGVCSLSLTHSLYIPFTLSHYRHLYLMPSSSV